MDTTRAALAYSEELAGKEYIIAAYYLTREGDQVSGAGK